MATLTIRGIDDELRNRLRVRAAENGRSMEAEVRAILRESLEQPSQGRGLGTRIHQRFGDIGGVEIDVPGRSEPARSADLSA
jgi:plasmid stability protein